MHLVLVRAALSLALLATPALASAQTLVIEAPVPTGAQPDIAVGTATSHAVKPPGLVATTSVLAQPPQAVYLAEPVALVDAPHLRFGIATGAVVGLANSSAVQAAALNPTLHLDLGVAIDRHFALYARGEVGTLIITNQAAAYAVAEWTPLHWLSLGSGVGWDGMALLLIGGEPCRGGACTNTRTSWGAVSIPLIVGFNVLQSGHEGDAHPRSTLRIGVEAAAGIEPASGTPGWHASLTVGYALM